MAKKKRLITVTAGRLVYAVCYTQAIGGDPPREREAKLKCSSAARRKLNFTAAWKKLQLLLCSNFERHDLYVTLGFDDEHLPPNRKAAKVIVQRFFDRMRSARRADGEMLKYLYSIHELQDDGSRRIHFHMVLNATQGRRDYEMIRSLWTWGSNIEISPISETPYYHNDDFLELAQYLMRERDPNAPLTAVGDKGFVGSRNLAKPVRTSELVDECLTLAAPPGAHTIDTDSRQNEYGRYDYIVYLLPERRRRSDRRRGEREAARGDGGGTLFHGKGVTGARPLSS